MRLRHLVAALVITAASRGVVEASPKAGAVHLDKAQTSYARETVSQYVRRAPTFAGPITGTCPISRHIRCR